MHPLWPLLPVALGLLGAWALLAWSARLDARGYVYRRAPALPIRALSAHDDAWLRGRIAAGPDGLLVMPHFGHRCVAYQFRIEEKRTRTKRDANGNTRTETYWVTVHRDSGAVDFVLVDETGRILVHTSAADEIEGMPGDRDNGFSRRHIGEYLPPGMDVSVLGVRGDGATFAPRGGIPLVITSRTRAAKVQSNDQSETLLRRLAFFVAFLGGASAWMLHVWPVPPGPIPWLLAVAIGTGLMLPAWGVTTFNRFVRLRQQRRASWRQIDVDLATRAALVPNLVEVVQAYRQHEAGLLERLSALRATRSEAAAIAGEQAAHDAAMGFLALREDHPELDANPLFLDLHERLWAIEEKLVASRSLHNRVLTEWNDLVQSFPSVLLARLLGHRPQARFAVDRSRDPAITRPPQPDPPTAAAGGADPS